ncbi:MAG: tRNA(Ser) Um(44) 2'-O-methyltransferase [Watsoniomyces obsoletus]|nr:MAG: tRNA(Ser) Um(44) 2'-O-methyltransferase [Watsoniomyces obsoletus]
MNGYTKRVHHDIIIPQSRYQNTYTRLKANHAKRFIENWKEVTDPVKHVFEDLGIAAFLIELWGEMYPSFHPSNNTTWSSKKALDENGARNEAGGRGENKFPGFVDIGCGNGVLVEILNREGWHGWGFDARRRKSWDTLEVDRLGNLLEMVLIPAPLLPPQSDEEMNDFRRRFRRFKNPIKYNRASTATKTMEDGDCGVKATMDEEGDEKEDKRILYHDGIFPQNTFLISNHADELTGWTPLLASLAGYAPFLIIPCCSHDLSGARARFNASSYSSPAIDTTVASPINNTNIHHPDDDNNNEADINTKNAHFMKEKNVERDNDNPRKMKPPEKGSLVIQPLKQPASPSTYAGLVAWTTYLAKQLGYENVEKETLRIPSTRNIAIISRGSVQGKDGVEGDGGGENSGIREAMGVQEVIERFGRAGNAAGGSSTRNTLKSGTGMGTVTSQANSSPYEEKEKEMIQEMRKVWIDRVLKLKKGSGSGSGH